MNPRMGELAGAMIWNTLKSFNISFLFAEDNRSSPLMNYIKEAAANEGKELYTLICSKPNNNNLPPRYSKGIFIEAVNESGLGYRRSSSIIKNIGLNLKIIGVTGLITTENFSGPRAWKSQGLLSNFLFTTDEIGLTSPRPAEKLLGNIKYNILTNNYFNKEIISPPVFDNNFVYWSAMNELYCLDLNSKEIYWNTALVDKQNTKIIGKLVLDNNGIYCNTTSGITYKIDKNSGNVIWKIKIATTIKSSPVFHNNVLYLSGEINENSGVYVALDSSTGDIIWKKLIPAGSFCTPTIQDNKFISGDNDGNLLALDIRDGTVLWSTKLKDSICGSPNIIDNVGCVTTTGGWLCMFNIEVGSIIVRKLISTKFNNTFVSTSNNNFIVCDTNGFISSYDTAGKLVWINKLEGSLCLSPERANDKFIAITNLGEITSISTNTGKKIKSTVLSIHNEQVIVNSTISISQNYLAVNTKNKGFLIYDFSS